MPNPLSRQTQILIGAAILLSSGLYLAAFLPSYAGAPREVNRREEARWEKELSEGRLPFDPEDNDDSLGSFAPEIRVEYRAPEEYWDWSDEGSAVKFEVNESAVDGILISDEGDRRRFVDPRTFPVLSKRPGGHAPARWERKPVSTGLENGEPWAVVRSSIYLPDAGEAYFLPETHEEMVAALERAMHNTDADYGALCIYRAGMKVRDHTTLVFGPDLPGALALLLRDSIEADRSLRLSRPRTFLEEVRRALSERSPDDLMRLIGDGEVYEPAGLDRVGIRFDWERDEASKTAERLREVFDV